MLSFVASGFVFSSSVASAASSESFAAVIIQTSIAVVIYHSLVNQDGPKWSAVVPSGRFR